MSRYDFYLIALRILRISTCDSYDYPNFIQNHTITLQPLSSKETIMQKFKTSMFFKVATAMLLGIAFPWQAHAQRTLTYFLEQARQNSPLIVASQNAKLQRAEDRQRLKALYTHARWELGGDLQFVPIITTDGGKTRFKADAQSADSYAGYDPGQTSSHLNAGIQVTQPLTGARDLRDANNLLQIQDAISDEQMRLTSHDLDRQVTERYLLCLLYLRNEQICHTIDSLLIRQEQLIRNLANQGRANYTDLHLIEIERKDNENQRLSVLQDYNNHYADLNVLCGTHDSLPLSAVSLTLPTPVLTESSFLKQYQLQKDQAEAEYKTSLRDYRPQLSFFGNAGSQTGTYADFYKRWGFAVGLHLTWTLNDGGQLKRKRKEMQIAQQTYDYQKSFADTERSSRLRQLRGASERQLRDRGIPRLYHHRPFEPRVQSEGAERIQSSDPYGEPRHAAPPRRPPYRHHPCPPAHGDEHR